ncbi:MAG: acyl-CoA thioesterase [Aeromicrobium erythreum]
MHELLIPMRWADLDQLNHVNNVVYVDYAEQARAALAESGEVADERVSLVDVEFRRPLLLSRTPVRVRTSVEAGATVHEIAPDGAEAPFATVRLGTTGEPERLDGPPDRDGALALRRGDVGPDGTVTPTRFFELCQESRILSFAALFPEGRAGSFVVGRVTMSLGEPLPWQAEPVPVTTLVTRVGTSSFATTTYFGRRPARQRHLRPRRLRPRGADLPRPGRPGARPARVRARDGLTRRRAQGRSAGLRLIHHAVLVGSWPPALRRATRC